MIARFSTALALSLLCCCGGEAPTAIAPLSLSTDFKPALRAQQELPEAIGKLVPEDALGVIQVRSLKLLIDEVKRYAKKVKPGSEGLISLGALLQFTGLRDRDLDLTRSAAIALSMHESGLMPTIILPVRDVDDAAEMSDMGARASGGYIGLGMAGDPPLGTATPAFAKALPSGSLVGRFDLEKILVKYRSEIDRAMDTPAPFIYGMFEERKATPLDEANDAAMFRAFRKLMDEVEVLDFALSLRDGSFDLDLILTTKDAAFADAESLALEGLSLAQMLPDVEASGIAFYGGDWKRMLEFQQPIVAAMAESLGSEGPAFLKLQARSGEMITPIRAMAFAVGFDSTLRALGLASTTQSDYLVRALEYGREYRKTMSSLIQDAEESQEMIDGLPFHSMRTVLDPAKMREITGRAAGLGQSFAESMEVSMAQTGSYLLMTVGDRSRASALVAATNRRKQNVSPMLVHPLRHLHAAPSGFVALDARQVIGSLGKLLGWQTPVPDGEPIMVWGSYRHVGKQVEVQVHLDLDALLSLLVQMN